jgi:CubicO group peptidase (beta-lactamase class C family)
MRIWVFLSLSVIPVQLIGQSGPVTPQQRARIDSVFAQWDRTNSPGCALGISRAGEMLYERGYGMANLETGLAISPTSIFHVASISKQFTAAAVALLASRGRLSLDDDIRKHVPEIPDYGTRITIRHLMHHTSGLRDQWVLLRLAGWRQEDLITEADVLWIASRQKALNFPPGSEYLYSNTGYTLLGTIVRRVSGVSLRQFADQEFFRPLGMTDTHFHDDHAMVVPGRTSAYVPAPGGWRVSIPDFDTYGATSLFTTVRDLLKWQHNFSTRQVLGKELLEEMQRPIRLTDGAESTYGFGIVTGRHRGLRTSGHAGADHGYRADVVRFVDHNLSIAALCNASNAGPSALTRRVGEILLAEQLAEESAPADSSSVTVERKQLERWTGTYVDRKNAMVLRFEIRGDSLALVPGPTLRPLAPDRFAPPQGQPEATFSVREGKTFVRLSGPGVDNVLERQPPISLNARALQAYAGSYYSEELDTRWNIELRDSALVLKRPKFPEARLVPVYPDGFSLGGEGGNLLFSFSRGAGNRVTGFEVGTSRLRGLRFETMKSARGN